MKKWLVLVLFSNAIAAWSQEITLHPMSWPLLTGLQSYTWGRVGDSYIIFGDMEWKHDDQTIIQRVVFEP